jgi:hypothetical protein
MVCTRRSQSRPGEPLSSCLPRSSIRRAMAIRDAVQALGMDARRVGQRRSSSAPLGHAGQMVVDLLPFRRHHVDLLGVVAVYQSRSGYLDNHLFKVLIIGKVDRFFPGPVQEFLECLEFMFLGSRVIIKFIKYDHSS